MLAFSRCHKRPTDCMISLMCIGYDPRSSAPCRKCYIVHSVLVFYSLREHDVPSANSGFVTVQYASS